MPTRYHLGLQAIATSDAAGVMAALATLFAVATDVDDGSSTSGILTWTRDSATATSQAIYSNAFGPRNSRIIIAVHDSGAPPSGPTMLATADTYTAANVLIGICDNAAGAYVNWYVAAPFSGCTFAGYYRLAAVASSVSVRAKASSKDLVLGYNNTFVASAHGGAVLAAPTSPAGFAESDGYRYGLITSGIGDMDLNWRSNSGAGAGIWGKNGTTNGTPHAGVYAVGGSTWVTMTVATLMAGSSTADTNKMDATTAAKIGIPFRRSVAPLSALGGWAGVSESALGLTGQVVNAAGTAVKAGVRWASSIITAAEEAVVFLKTF